MALEAIPGIDGSNPLGFLASIGLLRILSAIDRNARLGFDQECLNPRFEFDKEGIDLAKIILDDATGAADNQPWLLEYGKMEKRGSKQVADLKAPPDQFSAFVNAAVVEWLGGRPERAGYAAAYGTEVATDNKGNTKPTAFHFTAANQQFIQTVEESRKGLTFDWIRESLQGGASALRAGTNLRWDPLAERSRALMGVNPNEDGTRVNAPLEWLAFRALPAFPCVPVGKRVETCGVTGRRQDELCFHWPLWSPSASYSAVRSLLPLVADWSESEKNGRAAGQRSFEERRLRGVFAICSSEVRRTAQGFGNFSPARVQN